MKKLIALLLALTFVLGFAACGKKNEPATMPNNTGDVIVDGDTIIFPEDEFEFEESETPEEMPEMPPMPEEIFSELKGIMDQLVGGINDEMVVDTIPVTADMYEYYGVPFAEGLNVVVSMPMISAIAHEVVLVQLPEGVDASAFAAEMEGKQDPMKWVCVQPEVNFAKPVGSYVVGVMSTADMADAIAANAEAVLGA